jgi:hypothetical protein
LFLWTVKRRTSPLHQVIPSNDGIATDHHAANMSWLIGNNSQHCAGIISQPRKFALVIMEENDGITNQYLAPKGAAVFSWQTGLPKRATDRPNKKPRNINDHVDDGITNLRG